MKAIDPLTVAARGKGLGKMLRRTAIIGRRYGFTSRNMDRILTHFAQILETYQARATFPITGAALARSDNFAGRYIGDRIEFAAHGYYHVDHRQRSAGELRRDLTSLRRLFAAHGVDLHGFRCPYLRWNEETLGAIEEAGLLYDSSQALYWDLGSFETSPAYRRVLDFYGALPAARYPALPRLEGGLVRIPYCLPDDEALIDRLLFSSADALNRIWSDLLVETHRLGELFTLGLHPERLELCAAALTAALERARVLSPAIWHARLDEVARWWRARMESEVMLTATGDESFQVTISGAPGLTIVARGVDVDAATEPWYGPYRRVLVSRFCLRSARRPAIGVSPASTPAMADFLRQQGYVVERGGEPGTYAIFLHRPAFAREDERPLLDLIEGADAPLVRLGRWPDGARSALSITGDIDALTIWDYGLRFLGN